MCFEVLREACKRSPAPVDSAGLHVVTWYTYQNKQSSTTDASIIANQSPSISNIKTKATIIHYF